MTPGVGENLSGGTQQRPLTTPAAREGRRLRRRSRRRPCAAPSAEAHSPAKRRSPSGPGRHQPLEADDYARWRERKLRRGQISTAPELAPGRYALVLVAIEPATTGQFTRHGAGSHLTPPTVGEFRPTVEPTVALAATLASWLELFGGPVALAPPLLHTGQRWRVADLGHQWPLAPYQS